MLFSQIVFRSSSTSQECDGINNNYINVFISFSIMFHELSKMYFCILRETGHFVMIPTLFIKDYVTSEINFSTQGCCTRFIIFRLWIF